MIRALRWLVLLASLVVLVASAGPGMMAVTARPASAAVDILPVWCQARRLVYGEQACNPTVMAAIFHKPVGPARDTSSPYYYPPTAALLLLPTAGLPFEWMASGFRWVSAAALVAAAGLVVWAVPVRDPVLGAAAAALFSSALFSLRLVRGSLVAGQTGPVVVGLTAASLWAIGRDRGRLGGVVTAIGIALKLFPGLVLAALIRRRAGWPWLIGTLGLLIVVTFLFPGHAAPFGWLGGAIEFVDRPMRTAWERNEPAWVLALWRWRIVGLGVPTAVLVVWSAWRARSVAVDVGLAFVLVAWGGTVMAGSPQTHEGLVVVPALLWVLAWPVQTGAPWFSVIAASAVVGAGLLVGVGSPLSPPNSLQWVPMGYAAWAGGVVRWAWSLMDPVEGSDP